MVKVKLVNHDIGFCRAYYKVVEHECFEGRIWCVLDLMDLTAPDKNYPNPENLNWYSCNSEIQGEPNSPIREEFKNEIVIV